MKIENIEWSAPLGGAPDGWVELQTIIGNWHLRVWVNEFRGFDCAMVNLETFERRVLPLGVPLNLQCACDTAKRAALASINNFSTESSG